jgi:stage II sporulation protein AA (anti-sigma F factor antagonist)
MSDDICIVHIKGRLDTASSAGVEKEISAHIAGGRRRMLLDFSDLHYVSSIGLRTVLVAAKRMNAEGGKLSLCSLNPQVAEVFSISGFASILDIHPTPESAEAKLRA